MANKNTYIFSALVGVGTTIIGIPSGGRYVNTSPEAIELIQNLDITLYTSAKNI